MFGGTRRAVQAAAAESVAVQADLADARVQLAAEVAQAYVDLRDREARQDLAQRTADLEARILDLTEQRRAQGVASDWMSSASAPRSRTRARASSRSTSRSPILDQLAVLTGREPGSLDAELIPPRPLPTLPPTVLVGDPAAMLRRRPDIRAAEFRLASQTRRSANARRTGSPN